MLLMAASQLLLKRLTLRNEAIRQSNNPESSPCPDADPGSSPCPSATTPGDGEVVGSGRGGILDRRLVRAPAFCSHSCRGDNTEVMGSPGVSVALAGVEDSGGLEVGLLLSLVAMLSLLVMVLLLLIAGADDEDCSWLILLSSILTPPRGDFAGSEPGPTPLTLTFTGGGINKACGYRERALLVCYERENVCVSIECTVYVHVSMVCGNVRSPRVSGFWMLH